MDAGGESQGHVGVLLDDVALASAGLLLLAHAAWLEAVHFQQGGPAVQSAQLRVVMAEVGSGDKVFFDQAAVLRFNVLHKGREVHFGAAAVLTHSGAGEILRGGDQVLKIEKDGRAGRGRGRVHRIHPHSRMKLANRRRPTCWLFSG